MIDGQSLMLRGIAKREGDYWASIVLDFNVVGTGDSPEDAIMRSIWMTRAYIEEGCQLGKSIRQLKRRAPLRARLDYYYLYIRSHLRSSQKPPRSTRTMPFSRPVPVAAAC